MSIPKVIHQTYVDNRLPIVTKLFIWWMKRVNPDYHYEFYDDQRVEEFLKAEFPPDVFQAYSKLAIGAAKGDFFRYAVLYIKGGVYIDIDGAILKSLAHVITPDDHAVLAPEFDYMPERYAQWALIYDKGHPFLSRTLAKCIDNINTNRYPDDVLDMTGPGVYSEAIKECLAESRSIPYRVLGMNYGRKKNSVLIPKHFLNAFLFFRRESWRKTARKMGVLKSG